MIDKETTASKYPGISALVEKGDILLAIGVIMVLGGLIIPLPSFIIDVALVFNIGVAMIIIMVSNFVEKPLEFSVFPSLLLFTALLRIGMNVATTRKILLEGHAGGIIDAFGNFVVGGNYVVGAIIFVILIVIQSKVIVAGSSRISEVAARFTLDAMPGKQMTIDADLNSGLLTEEEAREKRDDLAKEADFYGAMDGAAKFVRGDVTAGMIITGVNILGGLVIGIFFKDMAFSEALSKYTLLTIGDGLVAQIPSLIISVASGIIVTRAGSSSDSLGKELIGQMLFQPAASFIGGGALIISGLIPSMPILPFWIIGFSLLGSGIWVYNSKTSFKKEEEQKELEEAKEVPTGPQSVDQYIQVDPMSLEIGYGLVSIVDSGQGGDFINSIQTIRNKFAMDIGLVVPPIRIRDNLELEPNSYSISINGNEVEKGEIIPDSFMVMNPMNPEGIENEVVGIPTKEPAFGLSAMWVNEVEKNRVEKIGYTVVDAATVLKTHLTEVIKKYGYELLQRQSVQKIIDNLKETHPSVVEDIIPSKYSVAQVHRVLQGLLKENVSIRNFVTIFEVIGDYAGIVKDNELMGEFIRSHLKSEICKKYCNEDNQIYAISLDPVLENHLAGSLQRSELGLTSLNIDPRLKNEISKKIIQSYNQAIDSGILSPVVLTSPQLRIYFMKMFGKIIGTGLPVLSITEIAPNMIVQNVGLIKADNLFQTVDSES